MPNACIHILILITFLHKPIFF